MVETLQDAVAPVLDAAKKLLVLDQIDEMITSNLPVLIYFENYGILDSAIWLPRFLEDLEQNVTHPRVRTVNAMFKHVGLNPRDIAELGDGVARRMQEQGDLSRRPSRSPLISSARDRALPFYLNSASIDISNKVLLMVVAASP